MTEPLHEFVVDQLAIHKGHWAKVAQASGVPKRSLEKIARREWKNPGVDNLEKLASYFRSQPVSA